MTLEELDEELAAVTASLRRLRDRTIADFLAEAAVERNPYTRQMYLDAVEKVRAIGADA